MKQVDVAGEAGIVPTHLNAILSGRRNPSIKLAIRLEQATGIARGIWMFGSAEERRAAWREASTGKSVN